MDSSFSAAAKQRLTAYVVATVLSTLCLTVFTPVFLARTRQGNAALGIHAARIVHQGTSPVWDLGELPPKAMYFEPTVHYELNSTMANREWTSLVPTNGGIVWIGPNHEPFLVSMFHQLQCLDIIRQSYNAWDGLRPDGPSPAAHHCLSYLRQMLLCRRDTRLEPVIDTEGPHAVQPWGLMTCRDWRGVYEAHERNVRAL